MSESMDRVTAPPTRKEDPSRSTPPRLLAGNRSHREKTDGPIRHIATTQRLERRLGGHRAPECAQTYPRWRGGALLGIKPDPRDTNAKPIELKREQVPQPPPNTAGTGVPDDRAIHPDSRMGYPRNGQIYATKLSQVSELARSSTMPNMKALHIRWLRGL